MQRLGPVLLAAAIALSACGSGDDDVSVADVWARASAPRQSSGAVYFELTVAADDTLVGASVPASIATAAGIHEVVMDDGAMNDGAMDDGAMDDTGEMDSSEGSHDMSTDMDAGGQMRMQELSDGLALTGDQTVSFEPGGYHVMLVDLAGPLVIGDEFELVLDFASTDDVTVTVEVAETAP